MSFCGELKRELCALPIKTRCCRWTLLSALRTYGGTTAEPAESRALAAELAAEFEKRLASGQNPPLFRADGTFFDEKCQSCAELFARGAFLALGTVTDPGKSYHLELGFDSAARRDAFAAFLASHGITLKRTTRADKPILYLKESGAIEDFLVYIGANRAAFDVMNEKIRREFANHANRVANCETANIAKSVAAAQRYMDAIRCLEFEDRLRLLPPDLQETALLRLKHPDLSLSELGRLHKTTISKGAVSHRLNRIAEIAEQTE